MPDLLLEFFSEEIPARMQARAADDLKKMVTDRLVAAGLVYEGAKAFATPRRLALTVQGVPARQPDLKEERKGPKVGAPEQAIAGFLRAAGLTSIDQAKVQSDKKGDFYVAVTEKAGKPRIDVIGRDDPGGRARVSRGRSRCAGAAGKLYRGCGRCIRSSPPSGRRPKSRRSCRSTSTASRRGDITRGHRFMAPDAIMVRRFDDYVAQAAKPPRSCSIRPGAQDMILRRRQESRLRARLRADRGRGPAGGSRRAGRMAGGADGLVRRGVPHDPGEVIRATIRANQKCFVLRDPQTAKLTNKFILVANTEAERRRQGDHRRQRARHPRAAVGRQVLLRHRSEDQAGRPAAEIRADRVPRKARHPGRAHRAHRALAGRACAAGRRRCRQGRSAPRSCARPTC